MNDNLYQEAFKIIMLMRAETSYSVFEPDNEKIMNTIKWCHNHGFLHFDGECLMMGKTYTPWYNNDINASDILLYTKKSSRGKGLATKAIEEFIMWAKDMGAADIKLSQSTGITKEEFTALAEKFNLIKSGDIYNVR